MAKKNKVWRKPQLSVGDRMRIDCAPIERLRAWRNMGINGHPDFWNHVNKVLRNKTI